MFGLNDNKQDQQQTQAAPMPAPTLSQMDSSAMITPQPSSPAAPVSSPVLTEVAPPATVITPSAPPLQEAPATSLDQAPSPSTTPTLTTTTDSADTAIKGVSLESAYITTDPPHLTSGDIGPAKATAPTAASLINNSDDLLLNIKQQALQSLAPLVNHLEQTPEEKFKTTLMLIQASDNSSLIKEAYEAAGQITDEKVRAQALLDIVNEINYFTQKANNKNTS